MLSQLSDWYWCYSLLVFFFFLQPFDGTVYTFGFGSDHDAKMLEAISTTGGGVYYYIDSTEKVKNVRELKVQKTESSLKMTTS